MEIRYKIQINESVVYMYLDRYYFDGLARVARKGQKRKNGGW